MVPLLLTAPIVGFNGCIPLRFAIVNHSGIVGRRWFVICQFVRNFLALELDGLLPVMAIGTLIVIFINS